MRFRGARARGRALAAVLLSYCASCSTPPASAPLPPDTGGSASLAGTSSGAGAPSGGMASAGGGASAGSAGAASGGAGSGGAAGGASSYTFPNGAVAAVSLTYDDGLDPHLATVIPALDAHGFKGTFFLANFEGVDHLWALPESEGPAHRAPHGLAGGAQERARARWAHGQSSV